MEFRNISACNKLLIAVADSKLQCEIVAILDASVCR